MLQLLRDNTYKSHIHLNKFFQRDLNWFNTFLHQYNGITFYDHQKPHHTVYLDACLTGFLATCARNIWLLTFLFNIQLLVNHIPGTHNETADLLSRWEGTDRQFHLLSTLVPNYEWMPVHLDHTYLNENI